MLSIFRGLHFRCASLAVVWVLLLIPALPAQSDILGEIQFHALGDVEKASGIWVDGQYLGYLKELKGSRKVLLLPGKHEVIARQSGYEDFAETVVVEPGQKLVVSVVMKKDPRAEYSAVTAEVKFLVAPKRAAVFVDERFVGHVDEFDGPGQAVLLSPGKHRVKIMLPGYQTFETELNLLPNQKFELKTELFKGSILQAAPPIRASSGEIR